MTNDTQLLNGIPDPYPQIQPVTKPPVPSLASQIVDKVDIDTRLASIDARIGLLVWLWLTSDVLIFVLAVGLGVIIGRGH